MMEDFELVSESIDGKICPMKSHLLSVWCLFVSETSFIIKCTNSLTRKEKKRKKKKKIIKNAQNEKSGQ